MSDEEIPEADPKSELDSEAELEVEGGTLVWRDPLASGEPLRTAYLWPGLILLLILGLMVGILV